MDTLEKEILKYIKTIQDFIDINYDHKPELRNILLKYSDVIDIIKNGKTLRGLHTTYGKNFETLDTNNYMFNPLDGLIKWSNHSGIAIDEFNYSSSYVIARPETLEILKKYVNNYVHPTYKYNRILKHQTNINVPRKYTKSRKRSYRSRRSSKPKRRSPKPKRRSSKPKRRSSKPKRRYSKPKRR